MSDLQPLEKDYRAAFTGYLSRREEPPLAKAYEMGRAAMAADVGILELVRIHHDVFSELLVETRSAAIPQLSDAAAEFLLEVLAPFDMARRPPRRP